MKNITNYETFNEGIFSPLTKIPLNKTYQSLFDKFWKKRIRLTRIGNSVYSLQVKNANLRGLIFCKPQEYYEGYSDQFRNQAFELEDYIKWYKEFYGKKSFDYGANWAGFNVPSYVLEECFAKVKTITYYDKIMLSVMDTIKQTESGKYYLVGVDYKNGVLYHEFAHAMFYLLDEYKTGMLDLISKIKRKEFKNLTKKLDNMGYPENVMNDELQAYISTSSMSKICSNGKDFIELFTKFYEENAIEPEIIEIKYSH